MSTNYVAEFYKNPTNKYENMTATVSCTENEDTELMELVQKFKDTKATRERTEKFYLPRIKAIGVAKWEIICKQLLGLCEMAKEVGILGNIGMYLQASFNRDDTGELYRLSITYDHHYHVYNLSYGYSGHIETGTCSLCPDAECYPAEEGNDKDGWLVKWDEYNLYNRFRSRLVAEIQRRIEADEAHIRSVRENYDEIAGK